MNETTSTHPIDLLTNLRTSHKQQREQLQREFDTRVVSEYMRAARARAMRNLWPVPKFGKLSKQDIYQHDEDLYQLWFESYKLMSGKVAAVQHDQIKQCEKQLRDIATSYTWIETDEWVEYDIVWSSEFSTQTASVAYARNKAQLKLEDIQALGVTARIDDVLTRPSLITGFKILVKVSAKDAKLLHYAPGCDLIEYVRRCWAKGANPRVLMPFLPHRFEEKYGIDYFGRRTTPQPNVKLAL